VMNCHVQQKVKVGKTVCDKGAIRAVATAAEPGEVLFLSGKLHAISPISRRPHFTKFENNTSIGVAWKTFGTEFWKFYRKGSLFQKSKNFSKMFNI